MTEARVCAPWNVSIPTLTNGVCAHQCRSAEEGWVWPPTTASCTLSAAMMHPLQTTALVSLTVWRGKKNGITMFSTKVKTASITFKDQLPEGLKNPGRISVCTGRHAFPLRVKNKQKKNQLLYRCGMWGLEI